MTISVKLEFSFDTPDEAVQMLTMFQASEREPETESGRTATFEERVQRCEMRFAPIMDILTQELAKRGLKPVRLQDT